MRAIIGADLTWHVGEGNRGDKEVIGRFSVKERNLEGQMVIDFAKMEYLLPKEREKNRVGY